MSVRPSAEETRDRIIHAAGEVFAEHGYQATTVRQITTRAGVNVAAVNYYFRDKEELYLRVLREAKCQTDLSQEAVQALPGAPRDRLRAFIGRFVHNLLDPERPDWHARVITQEMLNPSPAFAVLADECIGPVYREVRGLIAATIGAKVPAPRLDFLASSLLGQCLFYRRSRPMIDRLAPGLTSDPGRIAAHVADFTLAALDGLFPQTSAPLRKPARSRATPSR